MLFALVLVQLMIMPDMLIVENYRTMAQLGLVDTILAIGLPYFGARVRHLPAAPDLQDHPAELDEAARVEGGTLLSCCGASTCRWHARSTWPTRWCR